MKLNEYLSENNGSELARTIGVTPVLVSQWKTGVRPVPVERCASIESATNGAVSRRDLRPDDWHLIWPELVDKEAA